MNAAAVEAIARVIHDEAGGCCEYGYDGCEHQHLAQAAAFAAMTYWFGKHAGLRAGIREAQC